MVNEEVTMTMSVLPGAMTGISTLMAGMVSINNIFMDMTRQIDSTFGLVDATVVTTGTVIAQFGLQAAEAFGEFEQGMKIVQMVSGQTRSEIEQLSQTANQFSVQYRMDIDQITEGLQTLGRAGLNSASEQSEVLQNGLNTAKLEGRELNSVLEELIQNTALLGGDLKSSNFGEQSEYVNDLLVATSMTAPITTHDVSETLKYSGGIAAAAGANIESTEGKAILEDYMGAIAAFAQKGVTGSIAGTALRAFFNKPATQDSSVTDALASIKLKPEYLWEDDEETMKPVSEQIKIIEKQMEKLNISTMDKLQIWSKIVGGKMGQQMMKLDSEDIKNLTRDIQKAEDATSLAAGSMQTYQANMKQMSEQGQVAFREFGGHVAQFLNPVISVITKFLEVLSNPYVSGVLFAGFLAAITKVYSVIKKILGGLKTEFAQFMSYFKSGEPLMAMKPSVERGLKRKGGYIDYTDYTAVQASSNITNVKDLVNSYKAAAQEDRLKYLRNELGLSDSQIAAREITSKWTSDKLVSGTPDNKIMEHLIDNDKLTREAFNDIFILSADEWRKKHQNSFQKVINNLNTANDFVEEVNDDIQAKLDSYKAKRNEIRNNTEGNVGSRDKGPADISDENWYGYGRPTPGIISGDALNYQNEYFENIKDDISLSEVKVIDSTRVGSGILSDPTIGSSYLGKEVEDLDKKMEELRQSTIPVTEEVEVFEVTVEETAQAAQEASLQMTKLNQKIFDFFVKDAGKDFNKNGYGVDVVDKHGLKYGTAAGRVPPIVRDILANPTQDVDLNNISKYNYKNDLESYLSRYTMDEKGAGIVEGVLASKDVFGETEKFFNKKMKELEEYLAPKYFNSVEELALGKNELKDKDKFMNMKQISQYVEDTYGKTVIGKTRAELAKNAFPYLADWSVDGNHGGMTNAEFQAFARSLGADVSGKRSDMISQLNKHLMYNQYDNPLNMPVYRHVSQPTGDISGQAVLNDLAKSAEEFREAARLQVEAAKLRKENDNWDPNEEAKKRREHVDDLTRTEGKKTAERLGVKKDPETLEQTQERLHKELEEQQEEKILREKQLENQNEINHFYSNSNDALRTQYNRQAGPHPYFGEDESVFYTGNDDPWGYGVLAREQANKSATSDDSINTKPFEGDGYQEFYENLARDTEEEMYKVLDEVTGSTYRKVEKGYLSKIKESSIFQGVKGKLGWSNTAGTLKNLGTAASNVANIFGGPLILGMMAFQAIMTKVQEAFQAYCDELKDAQNQLKDAYSDRSNAEDALKSAYREQNPDATENDIEGMALSAYATMQDDMKDGNKWMEKVAENTEAQRKQYAYDEEADDGSYKEVEEELTDDEQLQKSIDENTSALYTATAEINVALNKLVAKMDDHTWGIDGIISELSDRLGYMSDTWLGMGEGSSFSESGGFLMTASQKDSNYPGYTELAGLFLEDAFDTNGSLQGTIDTLFGADAERYMGALNSGTKEFLKNMADFSRSMGRSSNSRLQASMMNDKKSWQGLAKEVAKYESKNKKSVGTEDTKNTRLENLIKKLQIDTGLNRIQVLQAAYLQQMQDMYSIAEQVMVPLIAQNATAAANTMMLGQAEFPYNQGTTNYTYGTMQIAQAISAQLATIAWAKAGEATRNAALADPNNPLHELAMNTDDGNQFMKEAIKQEEGTDVGGLFRGIGQVGEAVLDAKIGGIVANQGKSLTQQIFGEESMAQVYEKYGITPLSKQHLYVGGGDTTAMDQILDTFGATTYTGLGMSMNDAIKAAQEDRKNMRASGEGYSGIYDYFAKMWGSEQMAEQVFDAYMASGLGEADGGSGSGSGSGSGDKDKTGTRKERVDLVLCNKKEIPKLNVNLFKKPPTFTVLNKNFKLRDVKINTEDTPKAIMSSIKNAFIDVQKRTDPKIIQDEEAVYDPAGATDGNPLPSGTAKTKTE